mmetsp:Transcript_29018/g.46937  ORF Transcript_29018/g.46937 Transcript_29018/m.46937 type:complete len:252 (-) Transcript_29018:293-1048(-)|eukprot:CAMPEP_0184657098 /NCGR_PEP_ID=MMETSP0308-20130426/16975_1 /TAXON_ID=38269 /ORGANISM="Gloeochaete witrockiana, Strain SAG 46.84" /LENGTH=251 /DNA_ID=CAMNT_0027094505 /DNA_START=146 /DNA_END=901 /DNA_ORIENTATION=+
MASAVFPLVIKFLNSTDGRDKVAKFIQYGSRYANHRLQINKARSGWVSVFPKAETAASSGRKLFRLGKSINFLARILKNNEKNATLRRISIAGDLGLVWYFIFDNISFLSSLGVFRYQPPTVTRIGALGWFVSLVCAIALDSRQMLLERIAQSRLAERQNQLLSKLSVIHTGDSDADGVKAVETELVVVRQGLRNSHVKMQALLLNQIKNWADLQIARSLAFPKFKSSPGVLGVCGVISALVGAYQVWPTS